GILRVDFVLLLALPPLSTPLPYTTLFRSRGGNRGGASPDKGRRGEPAVPGRREYRDRGGGAERAAGSGGPGGRDGRAAGASGGEDRKSTRLNSSHQIISYAVFCLKTKQQL